MGVYLGPVNVSVVTTESVPVNPQFDRITTAYTEVIVQVGQVLQLIETLSKATCTPTCTCKLQVQVQVEVYFANIFSRFRYTCNVYVT